VICADDTGMPIWDLTLGKETRRLAPLDRSPAQVAFAPNAFAPTGKWLAVASGQIYPDTGGTVAL